MKLSATIYSKNTPRKLYRVVEEHFCQPCPNLAGMFLHSSVHRWASRHSLGFEDENLGSSPSWWAATVATYCQAGRGNSSNYFLQNLANDGTANSVHNYTLGRFSNCVRTPQSGPHDSRTKKSPPGLIVILPSTTLLFPPSVRHPFSKACLQHSQTVI